MSVEVNTSRAVFGKRKFTEVVDTDFSTFGLGDEGLPISIEEFFNLYEDIYLDIPLTGENSHTYLINRSSELVNVDTENTETALLFQEINDLREQVSSGSILQSELVQAQLEIQRLEDRVSNLQSLLAER